MNHYVYYLRNKQDNKTYIGVRSCRCLIEEDPYMSSAKTVSKEYLSNCTKTILKTFSTRAEAVAYEIELHDLFDVANNPLFFNAAKQISTGFDTSGKKLTEEHKQKISQNAPRGVNHRLYGKKHSPKAIALNREAHKGFNNAIAKRANIYDAKTHKLIASNICIHEWATENGYRPNHLYETIKGTIRKTHKGVYAKYP